MTRPPVRPRKVPEPIPPPPATAAAPPLAGISVPADTEDGLVHANVEVESGPARRKARRRRME